MYKKPRVEETKKGREESGRGRRDSRLNQRAKYKKERGGENRKKRSITRKSGGRREISFTRSVRKPFDASNQRHDVRILIIEAFICTTTIVRLLLNGRRIYLCHLNNANKYGPRRIIFARKSWLLAEMGRRYANFTGEHNRSNEFAARLNDN